MQSGLVPGCLAPARPGADYELRNSSSRPACNEWGRGTGTAAPVAGPPKSKSHYLERHPPSKCSFWCIETFLLKKIFILRPPTMGPSMGPICTLLPLTVPYYISWSAKKPKSLFGYAHLLKMFLLMYWNIVIKRIFHFEASYYGSQHGSHLHLTAPYCTLLHILTFDL